MSNISFLSLLSLLLLTSPSFAQTLKGRVVAIEDGDKLTVLTESKEQVKVRIAGIDAPENGQTYSQAAKENLFRLVFNRDVVIEGTKRDRYGYTVAKVLVDRKDAGLEQIRAGYAWHFKRYEREQNQADRKSYAKAEERARRERRGLWQDASPVPPWEWSDAKRS